MNLLQSLATFSFLFVFFENGVLQSPYTAKFNSVYCWGDPVLIVNVTCKLKAINWDKTLLLMDSDLTGVIKNATLNVLMFKNTGTQYRLYMLNATLNFCKALKDGQANPYLKVILERFTNSSSINHTCPYWGHLKANVYFDSSDVRFVIPYGKYKFEFNFYEGWPLVHMGTFYFIVSIVEKTRPKVIRTQAMEYKKYLS